MLPISEGGTVSVVVFEKREPGDVMSENRRPFGTSTTFCRVFVLTDSRGRAHRPRGGDLETIWMSLGKGSHYRAVAAKGQGGRHGGRHGGRGGLSESTRFATGSARGRQMEGNAMCRE